MAYTPHELVKATEAAAYVAEGLSDTLVIANTVTHSAETTPFSMKEGETITMKVPGTLPIREYALHNDRSKPIVTDVYSEQTVNVTMSGTRPYSAVRMTDEQKDFEFNGNFGGLLDVQLKAMAGYLELGVYDQLRNAPYEVLRLFDDAPASKKTTVEQGESPWFNFFTGLQMAMRKMRSPGYGGGTALIGFDIAERLQRSGKLTLNAGLGDGALSNASIGSIAGVNFIPSADLPMDVGMMYDKSAVTVHSGTHSVPGSLLGGTASANGWAVRWMQDYESGFLSDRSVIDCLSGYQYTKDRLMLVDQQNNQHQGKEEFFTRGVLFGLKGGTLGSTERSPGDGSTATPGGKIGSWLAKAYKGEKIETTIDAGTAWPLAGNAYDNADIVTP